MIKKEHGFEFPDGDIPDTITIVSDNGESHTFALGLRKLDHIQTLIADEIDSDSQYNFRLYGEPAESLSSLWARILTVIEKSIHTKYLDDKRGHFIGDTVIGSIGFDERSGDPRIIIDGKPVSWDTLKENIATYEGFRIKIEFIDSDEDLFRK
jgi:hypothetical protein